MQRNDIEFLEMLVRTMDREPITISEVKQADNYKEIGMITIRLNECDYTASTITDVLQMLKEDYARYWLRHVKEKNTEYRKNKS